MSTCGSFSPDSYQAFTNGVQNPANFMVMGPAAHVAPNTAPGSFYMDESDDEEEEGMDWGHEDEEEDEEEFEPNARMAMGQLRSMAQDVMDILSVITPDDYLEPWVAAKITMSKQNLSAVADYLRYND
jgi:hypothetical protein